MTRVKLIVALALCVGLGSCSKADGGAAGDEPVTPQAIAAITQEHIDLLPTEVAQWDVFTRELGEESPAASLAYADVSLAVVVAPTSDSSLVCADQSFFTTCVDDSIDGHDVIVGWQNRVPEEDPGVVYVIDRRDGEDVAVQVTGPDITGDPRDLDLGVPLDDLAALVTDPRLSLTTSQDVVDLGDEIELAQP